MNETGDLGSHILTVAIIVFYWMLLGNWMWPQPGNGKAKHTEAATSRPSENSPLPAARLVASRRMGMDFDAAAFLSGAAKAYETVLQAYAGGNVDMLKRYVGPEVFGAFERAIVERRERNETLQLTFVGMHEATILDTMRTGDLDEVAVRFVGDVVSVTRSADDGVIAGDAQNIVQVTDVWTFSRNVLSNDPNWQLVATSGD